MEEQHELEKVRILQRRSKRSSRRRRRKRRRKRRRICKKSRSGRRSIDILQRRSKRSRRRRRRKRRRRRGDVYGGRTRPRRVGTNLKVRRAHQVRLYRTEESRLIDQKDNEPRIIARLRRRMPPQLRLMHALYRQIYFSAAATATSDAARDASASDAATVICRGGWRIQKALSWFG